MKTVTRPADIPDNPAEHATPYFRRQAAVLEAIEAASSWYAGGLPPDPLAS